MIDPPRRDQPYPGRLPPVWQQWTRLDFALRVAIVGVPCVVIALLFAASIPAGVAAAVVLGGMGAATGIYVMNRTDRHNAAVERGEIAVVDDPHFEPTTLFELDPSVALRLEQLGYPAHDVGRVVHFDGGWLVQRRNRADVSVVVGEDGGWAFYDPRRVTALWAASEYLAGRGRESEAV
ncbi:MAG: hypothetical protein ACRDYY_04145 [Acidimicrobiales bacterium]